MIFSAPGAGMDWENSAQSVEDWIALAQRHRNGARALKKDKQFSLVWDHTGFSVECYLKAAIMRQKGWNRWPDSTERRDLWVHETSGLLRELGVTPEGLGAHPIRYRLKTILDWRRRHGYNPNSMPEKYAEQIYRDAFSSEGVVEWIVKTFHLLC
jgi:hypothetical protein